jgi:hypothetical protein
MEPPEPVGSDADLAGVEASDVKRGYPGGTYESVKFGS